MPTKKANRRQPGKRRFGQHTPITIDGETKTALEWADNDRERVDVILGRLNGPAHWTEADAVRLPTMNQSDAARRGKQASPWSRAPHIDSKPNRGRQA